MTWLVGDERNGAGQAGGRLDGHRDRGTATRVEELERLHDCRSERGNGVDQTEQIATWQE
jgi:hypothetical protein